MKEVSSYDTTDNFGGCLKEGHKPVNPSIMAQWAYMKGHEYGCIMWSFCSYDTQDVEVLGVYITDRKFTRKLVAMTPQTTLVGVYVNGLWRTLTYRVLCVPSLASLVDQQGRTQDLS